MKTKDIVETIIIIAILTMLGIFFIYAIKSSINSATTSTQDEKALTKICESKGYQKEPLKNRCIELVNLDTIRFHEFEKINGTFYEVKS